MRKSSLVLAMAVVSMSLASVAATPELVGSVTTVKGPVFIVRDGKETAAEKGLRLYPADMIRTGEGGGIGVVLRDDSTFSLGPSSELKMSDFAFKPDEGILGMTLSIAKGTLVYISGQIAKLAPGSTQIETPAGVAAVRGTELLVEVRAPKSSQRTEKPR